MKVKTKCSDLPFTIKFVRSMFPLSSAPTLFDLFISKLINKKTTKRIGNWFFAKKANSYRKIIKNDISHAIS